jgi:hypothetical protein
MVKLLLIDDCIDYFKSVQAVAELYGAEADMATAIGEAEKMLRNAPEESFETRAFNSVDEATEWLTNSD